MPVDDEVGIGCLLILADTGFDQGSIFQGREAEREVIADVLNCFQVDQPFAGGGIEGWPARVGGEFEAAVVAAGNAVEKVVAVVAPDGQVFVRETRIASGGSEEQDCLLGGGYQVANRLWEQTAEPGAAGENIEVGFQERGVREGQAAERGVLQTVG